MKAIKTPIAAEIISKILNRMITTGFVPTKLKEARTILIFKGGDSQDLSRWRPISISSVIRRVISRTLDSIIRHNISLNPYQRGFMMTPGTFININIVDGILHSAASKHQSAALVFLDISRAFDNIGHAHLCATLKHSNLPLSIQQLLINLLINNTTCIELAGKKTNPIKLQCGVMQGDPISPILFNLSINHILNELSDRTLSEKLGFHLTSETDPLSVLCFADDLVIIGKDVEAASQLVTLTISLLQEIGLNINTKKSQAIILHNGILQEGVIQTTIGDIKSISADEEIKYLGVSFKQALQFNQNDVLTKLKTNLDKLASTHLLQAQQKLTVLNQFICPTLIYPFQAIAIDLIPKSFLLKADKMIRSCVKEILQLPSDTPSSMIYCSNKHKGLSILRASWEAFLQQLNINTTLKSVNDQHVNIIRNYDSIQQKCLSELQLEQEVEHKTVRQLRTILRDKEFSTWCSYPHKGKGVELFKEVPAANNWILQKKGLSSSEWRDIIKMNAMVVPVRSIPGRSSGTTHCRHCSEYETLPHVLGKCPQGELLRIKRHNSIRSLLAAALRGKGLEVHEEVHCLADEGSSRRIDIIAINRSKMEAEIIDPTVRFEINSVQPLEVDAEKKNRFMNQLARIS